MILLVNWVLLAETFLLKAKPITIWNGLNCSFPELFPFVGKVSRNLTFLVFIATVCPICRGVVFPDFPYTAGRDHSVVAFSKVDMLRHDMLLISSMPHCLVVICRGEHICICKAPNYKGNVIWIYTDILKWSTSTPTQVFFLTANPFFFSWHFMTTATDTKWWKYINSSRWFSLIPSIVLDLFNYVLQCRSSWHETLFCNLQESFTIQGF